MLKILIASEDGERLAEIARLLAASGSYQVMRLQDAPARGVAALRRGWLDA